MGTNYYLREKTKPACPTCGHPPPRKHRDDLHIGKSSAGWCFSLHVYPDEDWGDSRDLPKTLDDWKELFESDEFEIYDEYEEKLTVEKMLDRITKRTWGGDRTKPPHGYRTLEQFYSSNHAVPGPNGLVRHLPCPGRCLGPGPDNATYDLIVGAFS